MKKFVILGLILIFGLILRCYHINFPSIGYHNMIENDYLSMAQEMQRTGDYVNKRIYFHNAFDDDPKANFYLQPPLVSYQILFAWKLLGENLWGPRLINVLFGILSIIITYFIALVLFQNINLSLICAFLLAILPLGVFFSRSLQPESPALFFMLLANLFYLRFITSYKKYNLFFGGLLLSAAWAYRFSFLIGILPIIFCLPWRSFYKKRKEFLRHILIFLLPYTFIILTIIGLRWLGQWQSPQLQDNRMLEIFTPTYWNLYGVNILKYIRGENYTLVFSILALLGIILAFLRSNSLVERYIIGWTLAIIPYIMLFSGQIHQQNFIQMPFILLVCVSCVYIISFISENLKKFFRKELVIFVVIAITATSAPFIYGSIQAMYGTVFLGIDVAGASLRDLTYQNERVFLLTHAQGYGIARYARRYAGWSSNLEEFKKNEKKFNIRYICIYPIDFLQKLSIDSTELFNYIQSNYHIKEMGFLNQVQQMVYIILEKGEGQNLKDTLESFSGQMQLKNIYKLFGRFIFFYALTPNVDKS